MNIGITIDISLSPKNSPTNQSIILIADTLVRAGHKCFLITNKRFNPHRKNSGGDILKAGHFLARFDPHEKSPIPFDMCIEAGYQYEPDVAQELKEKNPKCKFIYFCFEDQYLLDSLASTTGLSYGPKRLVRQFDEIWTWKHLSRTLPYLEATYGCTAKTVPFLWDSKFINEEIASLKRKDLSPFYSQDHSGIVCVLEENKNTYATCLTALAICEKLNHKRPELIEKVSVTNCDLLKKSNHFKDLIANLAICNLEPQKVYFNNKWSNPHALSRWGNVVITNSMFGDLSARHLEFLYLEFPLLHNISAIRDYGYYYSVENIKNAVNQLQYSLTMHNENLNYYKGQVKECLNKFSGLNPNNISAFEAMTK